MGNQQGKESEPEAMVTSYMFYHPLQKRYLAMRWDGYTHVRAWGPGAFERFTFTNVPQQTDIELVRIQVFGRDEAPDRYLALSENGNVCNSDAEDAGGVWQIETVTLEASAKRIIMLKSYRYGLYLCEKDGGCVWAVPEPSKECEFQLSNEVLPLRKVQRMKSVASGLTRIFKPPAPKDYPAPTVTEQEIEQYHEHGFVVCRNVIPAEVMEAAKQKIQEGLDAGKDRHKGWFGESQKWTKEYRTALEVMALFTDTAVKRNCEAVSGNVCSDPHECQLALRKKTETGEKDFALTELDWHIDAYEKITAARFGVLVVVSLSDWTSDNMGNFTVYPGSHLTVADMMNRMTWNEWNQAVKHSADLGVAPQQIHARAGDVILAHPLLAHDVAPNLTDDVRWAAIFRSPFYQQRKLRPTLLDPRSAMQQTKSDE